MYHVERYVICSVEARAYKKNVPMLYLIGLGLGDQDDITVRGLKCVQSCSKVFLEAYTSVLGVDKDALVRKNLEVCTCLEVFFNRRRLMERVSLLLIERWLRARLTLF